MGKRPTYKKPDHWSRRAQTEGYAARSVYKLQEIQKRFGVFRRGQSVLDLGAYPGSWSRYAAEQVGREGRVVGLDLCEAVIPGVHVLVGSVHDTAAETLLSVLDGPADVVLSDMAPGTTGVPDRDHLLQIGLAARALELSGLLLRPGGAFVCKVFDGAEAPGFINDVKSQFSMMKRFRPKAVRKVSREFFVVATGRG